MDEPVLRRVSTSDYAAAAVLAVREFSHDYEQSVSYECAQLRM